MTTPISSVTTASATTAATATTPPDRMGKDVFLQLLVAQLRHQNPMSPMEGTEFITQSAQMTMVEKLEELAQNSADALADSRSLGAAAMVGREVSYVNDEGVETSGTVTSARFGPTGAVLTVDGVTVPLAALAEVRTPRA